MNTKELFEAIRVADLTTELFEQIVFDIVDQIEGGIDPQSKLEQQAFFSILSWLKITSEAETTDNLLSYLLGVENMNIYLEEFLDAHTKKINYPAPPEA